MSGLGRAFFARPVLEVAPDLLGCRLVRVLADGTKLVGRIVEVEAYLGDGSDPGSHSHRGPTRRNRSMFGPPGHFYVYLSHGLHLCANLVCEPTGTGAAVLLRAVEPLAGEERMRRHRAGRSRGERTRRDLTNGPGKLGQAFAITLADDGASALRGALRIEAGSDDKTRSDGKARSEARDLAIETSPRIGLGKGVDLPYRFFVAGNAWVSRRAGRAR